MVRLKTKVEDSSSSEDDLAYSKKNLNLNPENKEMSIKLSSKGMSYALTSGVFASFAGTFGKFAMNQTETLLICEQVTHNNFNYRLSDSYAVCEKIAIYIRIFAFILMILLNAIMWTTFVKALRYCRTSLEATVTNTAANFFSSALVGQLVFHESVSLMWWLGTLLILFGLVLMNYGGGTPTGIQDSSGTSRRKKIKAR